MFLVVCLAIVLSVVDCAPFNAEGPFYNGDAASAPSFDIKVGFVCKNKKSSKLNPYTGASVAWTHCQELQPRWKVIFRDLNNAISFNLVLIKRLAKSKEEYYDFIYTIGLKETFSSACALFMK